MEKLRTLFISMALLLCSIIVNAHDFEVDGIYYNITSTTDLTVSVTYKGNNYQSAVYNGSVIIPSTVIYDDNTYNVTSIGDMAFYRCESLENISVPLSIMSIGNRAFQHCISLKDIMIPKAVAEIGANAFLTCTGLESIVVDADNAIYDSRDNCNAIIDKSTNTLLIGCQNTLIPSTIKAIGSRAFSYMPFKTIKIPESVEQIEKYAFQGSSIESITIPNSVTVIGGGAFSGCKNLKEISLPNNLNIIQSNTFMNCINLLEIIIPEKVIEIGSKAFWGCSSLTCFDSGDNLNTINNSAFNNCTNLVHVIIGKEVVAIPSFNNCPLESIIVDKENKTFDSRDNCNSIITTSTNTLILGCQNTIIPNSVTCIGASSFSNCKGLTSIVIPLSVTNIDNGAFSGCTNLSNAYLYSNLDLNSANFPETTKLHLTLNDNDKIDFDASIANTYADLTYNRELAAGKYGTIMLPFIPDAESLDNFAFFALSSVDGNTLIFDEVQSPEANTPYLYRLRSGKEATKITGDETTILSTIASPNISGWETIGSFSNQTIDCSAGDAYYYAINANDNMLYNVVSKLNVKPYRAYFKGAMLSASKLIIRTADNETTMIDAVEVEDLAPIYYDLSGRQVVGPSKGIYIKNGKKVVVK